MRILHVVTLVSRDGAYGGPLAVARMQATGLARLGHDVALVAGWDGAAELKLPGVDVRLRRARQVVPGMGFAALLSPGSAVEVARLAASADVVHVHLARDLVTLPAAAAVVALASHTALVVQTHGMVRHDSRLRSRVVDRLLTRRVLRASRAQLVLTDEEESDASCVARGPVRTERLVNGVPMPADRTSWPVGVLPHVVFSARLHPRKRPVAFVEMCADLLDRGFAAQFSLYGPDEGELPAVLHAISHLGLEGRVAYRGPLEPGAVLSALNGSQVYVLPSVDEPFPMSVLEAMSLGLPAVITRSNGLATALGVTRGATVTDDHPRALADAVAEMLQDRSEWQVASAAARDCVAGRFNADGVVAQLSALYDDLV